MSNDNYVYYRLKCKCGRKILVEILLIGTDHNSAVGVICAECLGDLDPSFKSRCPEEAEDIEKWRDGG